ncbi:MAG TPA: polymer-forming cytoskeletal protein [Steroidobacteraceae bacterium]|jgi:cytoskeletal protein CcmA (bactofilin family)|nr:polymer-forming cytoskeletal protein [Steroidobacteraceae bacterium]
MFSRDSRPPRIDTLIGKGVRVQGDIDFLGGMHLDGAIAGNVRSDPAPDSTLSVSESGSIDGSVDVPNVILQGQVRGDIRGAERVVLGATARVEGDVYYGVIEMTLGAQIMGKLVRIAPAAPAGAAAKG